LEALHGGKSPPYLQITRQSFQTIVNDLFERRKATFCEIIKRGGRKKTGTISLTKTLPSILSDTPLVKNLENAEYRTILLDGSDTLEERFAKFAPRSVIYKLDTEQNQKIQPEFKKIVRFPDLPKRLSKLLAA